MSVPNFQTHHLTRKIFLLNHSDCPDGVTRWNVRRLPKSEGIVLNCTKFHSKKQPTLLNERGENKEI